MNDDPKDRSPIPNGFDGAPHTSIDETSVSADLADGKTEACSAFSVSEEKATFEAEVPEEVLHALKSIKKVEEKQKEVTRIDTVEENEASDPTRVETVEESPEIRLESATQVEMVEENEAPATKIDPVLSEVIATKVETIVPTTPLDLDLTEAEETQKKLMLARPHPVKEVSSGSKPLVENDSGLQPSTRARSVNLTFVRPAPQPRRRWPLVMSLMVVGAILGTFLYAAQRIRPNEEELTGIRERGLHLEVAPETPRSVQDHYRLEHPDLAVRSPVSENIGFKPSKLTRKPAPISRARAQSTLAEPQRFGFEVPKQKMARRTYKYEEETAPKQRPQLVVFTHPPGVRVIVEGINCGASPVILPLDPSTRSVKVELQLPGLLPQTHTVSKTSPGTFELGAKMKKDPKFTPNPVTKNDPRGI